jgi:hypothetical protein
MGGVRCAHLQAPSATASSLPPHATAAHSRDATPKGLTLRTCLRRVPSALWKRCSAESASSAVSYGARLSESRPL